MGRGRAAGAVLVLEAVYMRRTEATLPTVDIPISLRCSRFGDSGKWAFALMVLLRTFDLMSDWATWGLALRSTAFRDGIPNLGMEWETVYYAALAFNIIGTLLWIPDMRALFKEGDSGLTKYVIPFEDIPQLTFAVIYIAAVLTTEHYGQDGDPCVYVGPLPLDPVVVVSLAGSSIGLFINVYLVSCKSDKSVLSG